MQILGAEILVTTEKDGVKLKALLGTGLSVEVWVAELELKCQDSLQSMHEFLADNALSQL